jgi:hypothetical protein
MTTYQYIISIISKYKFSAAESSSAYEKSKRLYPLIARWAKPYLLRIFPTGSYAKETAIRGTTDIDLFISLSTEAPYTLSEVYNSLSKWLKKNGYKVREQNVSIGLTLNNLKIDIVPAKKHPGLTMDHSIYRRKADTWTKTNINKHIIFVRKSGRLNEIRAMKIWRNLHGLEFPSFYLELSVINALKGRPRFSLVPNMIKVLEYFSDDFADTIIEDPSNSNNTISEDLTEKEKDSIAEMAYSSLDKAAWDQVIW